ncbi:MAG: hypothetical protein H6845_02015 [Alphaproteobacteria bacterium]|nr:MAG: hypothetical protein H6845_02015 [Alphaproteobacteria bacterium]
MTFRLNIPSWDIHLQDQISCKSKKTVEFINWRPNLLHKSSLNPHQLITSIFSSLKDTSDFHILTFLNQGRNYFKPPETIIEAENILKQVMTKRLKIFSAIKKNGFKHKFSIEWIVLKKMNKDELSQASTQFINYRKFIDQSGKQFIIKSGTEKNPYLLLSNYNIL